VGAELIAFFKALSRQELDPIKLAQVGRMAGSIKQPESLTDWVSLPAVLVTGPTVTKCYAKLVKTADFGVSINRGPWAHETLERGDKKRNKNNR